MMNFYKKTTDSIRPKFGQLIALALIWTMVVSSTVRAEDVDTLETLEENLIQRLELGRFPASYTPNDELEVVPYSTTLWLENLIVDDDSGVMDHMRTEVGAWVDREQFVEQWDIAPLNIYATPDDQFKKNFISKQMLRYLDKRLSGEIKSAKDGSTLASVGQVHRALKPNVEAQVSELVKLKFRARVLQGRLIMQIKNPFVESEAMVSASGRATFRMAKRFDEIGFSSRMEYRIDQGEYLAEFDQDINGPLHARVTSLQKHDQMMFTGDADQTIQLYFNYSF